MASAGQDLGSDAFVTIAESCRSSGTTPWTSRSASNAITDGYDLEYAEAEEPPLQSTSLHILGEGAYGTVTEVTSKETKQVMALKTIRLDQLKDSPAIARKEISSLRLLDHYHIVQIVGNYLKKRQPEDVIGLLLQPVADTDLMLYLTSLTQNSNRVYPDCGRPEEFLPKAFGCLANALRYIHKHKVEHLDLKPENILLKGSNVLITDFGVARIFNTRSDTSAPVTTTKKYKSPELAFVEKYHRSTDVFSLGCIFAEIFAVYKGRKHDEIYKLSAEPYHLHLDKVFGFLKQAIVSSSIDRCDVQIFDLIKRMLSREPLSRPSATDVWRRTTTCTKELDGWCHYFCGPCCMPFPPMDVSSTHSTEIELPKLSYATQRQALDITSRGERRSIQFKFKRNVRHGSYTIHDIVSTNMEPVLAVRKRIIASQENFNDIEKAVEKEAEVMESLEHRHIVKVIGRCQQDDVFTIFTQPAAQYDLRTYMRQMELRRDPGAPDRAKHLAESFGCLANALHTIHSLGGSSHRDIRPENILVNDHRVYLAKFGQRAVVDDSAAFDNPSHFHAVYAVLDTVGHINERKNDVYSLGCTFVEMYTILRGRTLEELLKYRHDTTKAYSGAPLLYRNTIPACQDWVREIADGESDMMPELIIRMIQPESGTQPPACEVFETLRDYVARNGTRFCCSFCRGPTPASERFQSPGQNLEAAPRVT